MAEIEIGGVTFKGGKILVVLTALSTAGGAMWAGFEFWKDYEDLQQTVQEYTAPDLSGIRQELAVQNETVDAVMAEMASVRLRVGEIQQLARDLREDVRTDSVKLYSGISAVDRRSRDLDAETRESMRQAEKTIRGITSTAIASFDAKTMGASNALDDKTTSAVERFDAKINTIDEKLDALEARLDRKLQRALDNPLLK
jgi:chromosome segregation ATPase